MHSISKILQVMCVLGIGKIYMTEHNSVAQEKNSEYSSSEQLKDSQQKQYSANHIGHHVLMNNISKHDMSTINNWILV